MKISLLAKKLLDSERFEYELQVSAKGFFSKYFLCDKLAIGNTQKWYKWYSLLVEKLLCDYIFDELKHSVTMFTKYFVETISFVMKPTER